MNAPSGIIHVFKGADIGRDTETHCGKKMESLPRADGSLPYRLADRATCPVCRERCDKIAVMRAGLHA